jgi:serine/threonine protein kinase
VVLYEAIAGARPFLGQTIPELLLSIIEDTPRPVRELRADVPEAVEAAVLRCLEKDPQNRFQSIDQLADALVPFAADWAQSAGNRTLAMAGRSRWGSQNNIASAGSSATLNAAADVNAMSSTQKTWARGRRQLPLIAAATLAFAFGSVLLLRHNRAASSMSALPSTVSAPATSENAPPGPAGAEPVADANASATPDPLSHVKPARALRAKSATARRAVDPLEGRK